MTRIARLRLIAAVCTALAGAGLTAVHASYGEDSAPPAKPAAMERPARFALVSDPHETRDPAKAEYGEHFTKVIAAINEANVDAVLIAGDLTDGGRSEQYDDFRQQVKGFRAPVRWVPGNHDIGAKRLKADSTEGVSGTRVSLYESKLGPTFWAETFAGVRVLGLNTPILGSGLPQEIAQWEMLTRELGISGSAQTNTTPLLLVQHYALFTDRPDEPGGGYWNIEPAPRQEILDLLSASRRDIRAILSGHLHRPLAKTATSHQIPCIGTPPVSFGIPKGKQAEGWTLVTVPPAGPVTTRFIAVTAVQEPVKKAVTP